MSDIFDKVSPDTQDIFDEITPSITSPEPSPMSPVEGASPWAMGEMPTPKEAVREVGPYTLGMLAGTGGAILGAKRGGQKGAIAGGAAGTTAYQMVQDKLLGDTPKIPYKEQAAGNVFWGSLLGGMPLAGATKGLLTKEAAVAPVVLGAGAKYNIPTTFGEDTARILPQKIETLMEKVPYSGMTRFRAKQLDAAQSAAKLNLSKYIANPTAPDTMTANREFVSGLYDEVKKIVAEVPADKQTITPTNIKDTAGSLLKRYPDIFKRLQDTQTEGILQDIVGGVKDIKTVTPNPSRFGELTPAYVSETVKKTPKMLTFDEAWTLRQGLGEKIGQARKLLARGEVDQTAYSQLKALYGAVSTDMDAWATKIGQPEITAQLNGANAAYKQYVVKYDIMQRTYDKAVGVTGAGEMFSPKTFSTSLKNIAYKDKSLKTFSPDEINEMTGLANVMQVVKRAGQYKENVPTGNRFLDLWLVKEAITTALTPISWVGTYLATNPTGKKLALEAANLNPASPEMGRLVQKLYSASPYLAMGGMGLKRRSIPQDGIPPTQNLLRQ